MSTLQQGPVHIEGHNHPAQVELSCFICDTPARAYIKQVKGHSGYYGCDKCKQKGAWDGKVIFPEVNGTSRSDVHFDQNGRCSAPHWKLPIIDIVSWHGFTVSTGRHPSCVSGCYPKAVVLLAEKSS